MQKEDFILPCSLGCMIYGIWISFCEIFECNVDRGSYLLPAFIIAGVSVYLLMSWRWRITFGILGAGAAAAFLIVMKNYRRLSEEAEGILYYVDLQCHQYYGKYIFKSTKHICNMDDTMIWIMLGIAFGIFITLFAFRLNNFQYGFLPCTVVVLAGLFLGKTPGIRGTIYMLVGIVLAIFWRSGREYGGCRHFYMMKVEKRGRNWLRYLLFFLALAGVLAAAARLAGDRREKLLAHEREVHTTQTRIEEKILQMATEVSRYVRGNLSIDSNGKLNNSEPKYAERTVLEITTSQRPRSDIYLKGFVGSHYSQGQWKQENVRTFQEQFPDISTRRELADVGKSSLDWWMEWMNPDDFDEEDAMPWESVPRMEQMKIDHVGVGKWSSYTYFPYFANLEQIYDEDTDELLEDINPDFFMGDSSRVKVSSSYYLNFTALTYNDSIDFYEASDNNGGMGEGCEDYSRMAGRPLRGDDKELQKYLDSIAAWTDDTVLKYLKYAWKEYGFQKESSFFEREEFIKKLRKYNSQYKSSNKTRNMTAIDRVQFVQKLLSEEAVYSKQLDGVPAGRDYAEFFLLEQKKGFCEHFATAGTLLMRELGIPSRYVGGYKIPLNRFKKNEDGSYTAQVLDSDAHAWTEVLAGSMGWFPAEMTPTSSSGSNQEKSVSVTPKPTADTPKQREEGEEPKSSSVSPTPTVAASASPTPAVQNNSGKEGQWGGTAFPGLVAAILGAVVAASGLWILGWRIYYYCRKKKLLRARGKSRNLYVRMRLHELLSYMGSCGVAVSGRMPEKDWFSAIEQMFAEGVSPGESPSAKEREEFLRIVQKAAFSREEVTQEEYDTFRNLCGRLEDIAQKKAGKRRRVYLKLTGRYGKM